ncbi:MAG: cbb3-type cytochrome c oxidase subunit 3 [Phyllobacteriaceae bacterium]|jgi:cytochrome c oxidase cbb3-type subunit 4|nr:cbb3-type cytochrome c oxidase subunit 3 [Phyllobacteriaceae bacterium]
MSFDYETLTAFAKSWGLFYLLAMTAAVLVYTFWPKNQKKFDAAKTSVLREEDRP